VHEANLINALIGWMMGKESGARFTASLRIYWKEASTITNLWS